MARKAVSENEGLPPWESPELGTRPVCVGAVVPACDMGWVWARNSRERREWCEAWLAEALEAGCVRARIGSGVEWPEHWWEALCRRGMGRTQGLVNWASEEQPGVPARLRQRIRNQLGGAWGRTLENIEWREYEVPVDWWEWWTKELTKDLIMMCCLYERGMVNRPAQVVWQGLYRELHCYYRIHRNFHLGLRARA